MIQDILTFVTEKVTYLSKRGSFKKSCILYPVSHIFHKFQFVGLFRKRCYHTSEYCACQRRREELRNCLEGRLKWYQEALEYRRKGTMPPIGFPLPDGDINTWEGAARELKNTLDMMK